MARTANTIPATANQRRRVAEAFTTFPVFPNAAPYNELLLSGKLRVGLYEGVKTRSWEWDHRGPVLFYTSGRTHLPVARAYDLVPSELPRKAIVGVGELFEVRALTADEEIQMYRNFNNWTLADYRKFCRQGWWEADYVEPIWCGFFFRNLRRFRNPIKFHWPPGPVRLNHAPLSLVAKSLKEVGYEI